MNLSWAGLKDVGNKRENQDDDLVMEGDRGVFAVFDGERGHPGELAASWLCAAVMAVDVRQGELERGGLAWLIRRCEQELSADRRRRHAKSYNTMTTVAALWARGDGTLEIAHVGDSRVYRWRAGSLEQLTEDHSLLNESLKKGLITKDEAHNFPYKAVSRVITSIETPSDIEISYNKCSAGDLYIICTDGLFTDDEGLIGHVLKTDGGAPAAHVAQALMGEALTGAASDNIALVVVRLS